MSDAVYEATYEPYEGQRTPTIKRVAAIARRGLSKASSSTWLWILVAVTLVHVALRAGLLYVTGQAPPGGLPPGASDQFAFTSSFLAGVVGVQARWMLALALVVVGSEAIAEDLEAGGLTFHLTKPIPRSGYLVGKLAAPFTVGLALTFLPALVLWFIGLAFTPAVGYPDGVGTLPFALLAGSVLVSLVCAAIVVALSAITGSRRIAALVWVGGGIVLAAAGRVGAVVTGEIDTVLVDVFSALDVATRSLLGVSTNVSTPAAWAAVAAWGTVALSALVWALSREEVAA